MSPKERIRAIRLMERFHDQVDYLNSIGVDISLRNVCMEPMSEYTED